MRYVSTSPAAAVARGEPLALLRLGLEHQPGVVTTGLQDCRLFPATTFSPVEGPDQPVLHGEVAGDGDPLLTGVQLLHHRRALQHNQEYFWIFVRKVFKFSTKNLIIDHS